MTKYIVSYTKTGHRSIEVEAENEKEAQEVADIEIDKVQDFEWDCENVECFDVEEQ